MAFFEVQWQKSDHPTDDNESDKDNDKNVASAPEVRRKVPASQRAMYTITALEDDTTVLAWSHADMQALLDRSSDMRAALTRAMTSAIVAKVVGFANSKKKMAPPAPWWTHLFPWGGGTHGSEEKRVLETRDDTPKVAINTQPVYALPEGKDCPA